MCNSSLTWAPPVYGRIYPAQSQPAAPPPPWWTRIALPPDASTASSNREANVRTENSPTIGVGMARRPPLPPNRTGGFPASGFPVGGLFIDRHALLWLRL